MKAVFLDIETNGLDPDLHRPIEIAIEIYDLHEMKSLAEYSSIVYCSAREFILSSSLESLRTNQMTWADLQDGKYSSQICVELTDLFLQFDIDKENAVFICQNPSFDRMFFLKIMPFEIQEDLDLPYHWLDLASMYYAKEIRNINFPLSKDKIALFFGIPIETIPHRAMNGVHHLIECYKNLFMEEIHEKELSLSDRQREKRSSP